MLFVSICFSSLSPPMLQVNERASLSSAISVHNNCAQSRAERHHSASSRTASVLESALAVSSVRVSPSMFPVPSAAPCTDAHSSPRTVSSSAVCPSVHHCVLSVCQSTWIRIRNISNPIHPVRSLLLLPNAQLSLHCPPGPARRNQEEDQGHRRLHG